MMFPVEIVVTVQRFTRDAFGDPVTDSAHTISGCAVLSHNTDENRDSRDQVVETATLALPPGSDLQATDQVDLPDGTRWHVAGRPWLYRSPFSGWQPGILAPIRRVTG